jgi:hypothetical protein
MILTLNRKYFNENSTIGTLQIDGGVSMFTLEDKDRQLESGGTKIKGETCIPRGDYQVILDFSTRFQKVMPHVLNVSHFDGIRIHSGNTDKDTEGCILVGGNKATDAIGQSRVTFNQLMILLTNAINHGETVTLRVI